MSTSFQEAASSLLTSESVTEGHPDKICDQISDAVLDACLAVDPQSRVACEAAVTTNLAMVFGEITTQAELDVEAIVRRVVREIGYTDSKIGFDAESCRITVALDQQSPDIKGGVDRSLELREAEQGGDRFDLQGAGDQGMMIGFACRETPELMPLTISLAHGLTRRLAAVRRSGEVPYLLPDGKAQVTVEYAYGAPKRVAAVVVSTQHAEGVEPEQLQEDIQRYVIEAAIPKGMMDEGTARYINPSGRFVVGGPKGDAGLTGRKIIVDTYGGWRGTAAGRSPARTRPKWTARAPTRRAGSRRIS